VARPPSVLPSIALVAWLAAAFPAAGQDAPGTIVVTGVELRSDEGRVQCLLFAAAEAEAFPRARTRAFAAATARIVGRSARCTFSDVPPGRYAVSVHHDADADGRVDTGLFGIPTEGLGASNDARGSFGPPSFDSAAFTYEGGALSLRVRVGYVF
jgi:uncharacterized protein (DUF2141 family)